MAKKKSGASKSARKIKPFDDMDTNEAMGKMIEKRTKELIDKIKLDEFLNDPQSPRA